MEKEEFLVHLEKLTAGKSLTSASFQQGVLTYFKTHGRTFDWRSTKNPYEILVSEVMLQQTQTERVAKKYPLFLEKFPTVTDLAHATLTEVLAAWEGLGYYRRARNLHAAARAVQEKFDGKIPQTIAELSELPGIGAYTACAIGTFAFGAKVSFIETNIRSVYLHFFFKRKKTVSDKEILQKVDETLYRKDTRKWFYALMDLGVAIKQLRGNPNTRSKHHRTQSTFAGSKRQARAAILRFVLKKPGVNKQQIEEALHSNPEHFEAALSQLVSERFIIRDRVGGYRVGEGS